MSDLNCIFIQGVAGVGKSSVSKLLSQKTGWTLIDRDAVGTSSIEDKDTERATAYENLARRAAEELGRGNRIVVDAPFLKEYQENTFTDWIDYVVSLVIKDIRHFELHYKAIWLSANQNKRKERRISRAAKRDSRITDWDAELQKEDREYLRPPGVLEIPTDSVLPDQVVEVIDWLGIGERKLRKATRADVSSIASIKESRIQDTFSFFKSSRAPTRDRFGL